MQGLFLEVWGLSVNSKSMCGSQKMLVRLNQLFENLDRISSNQEQENECVLFTLDQVLWVLNLELNNWGLSSIHRENMTSQWKEKTRRKQLLLWKNIKIVHAWALEQSIVVKKRSPERNLKKLCNPVCYCQQLFSPLK